MATHASIAELRNMQPADLHKEAQGKRMSIAKMRLGLEMRSEKDSALYRRERKELARMLTVLSEKAKMAPKSEKTALKTKSKASKVRAPRSK
jgi:ribosomal protein L29